MVSEKHIIVSERAHKAIKTVAKHENVTLKEGMDMIFATYAWTIKKLWRTQSYYSITALLLIVSIILNIILAIIVGVKC